MGREVRRVDLKWKHPIDNENEYDPLTPREMAQIAKQKQKLAWTRASRKYYMMYETTSEGTPISPSFKTKHELIQWLIENKASIWGDNEGNYEQWKQICNNRTSGNLFLKQVYF